MTDQDALLQAVITAPEEDLPRLVFADFLEESGHPANAARAQFIRLQIEAEGSPQKAELLAKAEELRPMFRDEWDQFFDPRGCLPHTRSLHRYVRGFAEAVHVHCQRLLDHHRELFAAGPIRELEIETSPYPYSVAGPPKLKKIVGLSRIRSLSILLTPPNADPIESPREPSKYRLEIDDLIQTEHLSALKCLILQENNLFDYWIIDFVRAFPLGSFYASLERLDLSNNRITDAGANALAAGRGLDRLTSLDLRDNRLTAAGIAMIRGRFGDRVRV